MIIYKTTNLINGKFYIGKSVNERKGYLGSGLILRQAIEKYGKGNFKKEIINRCNTKEELKKKEIYWIDKLKPSYNIAKGGLGGDTFSNQTEKRKREITQKKRDSMKKYFEKNPSKPMSEKQKEQIRKTLTGRKQSEETKKKRSETFKKIWKTEKHRKLIKEINSNPEHKKKLSKINKKVNWWKNATEEQRKKHSEAVSRCWRKRKNE